MNARQTGRWLLIVRLAWAPVFVLALVVTMAAIPARIAELHSDPYALAPGYAQAGISVSWFARYFTVIEVAFALVFLVIGAFIYWRARAERIGLLVAFLLPLAGPSTPLAVALTATSPLWRWPVLFLRVGTVLGFLLFVYLFPDGRPAPRWTRWPLALGVAYPVLWLLFPSWVPTVALLADADAGTFIRYLPVMIALVIGFAAQIYRYRQVSTALQRQQTKWVVGAFGGLMVAVLGTILALTVADLLKLQAGARLRLIVIGGPVLLLIAASLPLALTVSILRYRLWDIDLLIRRTLVYSLLTGALAAIYFGLVAALSTLFGGVLGQRSALAIVVSTLVIAALFQPLRARIQSLIDRRFYRQKYDAAQALNRFAATARDEVDLSALAAALLQTVNETVQPTEATLWLQEES
ncbi:MAG: hypothetical protein R3300_10745 [Candidatus Promineifilaceae bacterium]|nr:hypothetical protein [Candidatus Promineifilaceae bacterium]